MFASFSTLVLICILIVAAGVVLVASLRMTALADQIADRAGWGEALVGGLVLGAATSLSGLVVSVTGAASGDASLAFSNGVGGIAAQTVFLALADLGHRRANLEHAAAEPANLIQGVLLMTLLTLPLVGYAAPPITILGLHPITAVMIGMYVYGLRVTREVREAPMWRPVQTDETREDTPEDPEEAERSPVRPAIIFAGLALVLALSGWVIAQSAGVLIQRSGLSSSLVGALVTAVLTSLPELVTTLAAVRRGALQLAVGGVIGGNMFDTLFLAASDIAYRDGSLYHALGTEDLYWLATGLLMTAILLAGQIRRQRDGPAGIGFESVALLAVYGTAVTVQALSG